MRCSSLKSSGVKISEGVRSSIRKLPPLTISFLSITAAIMVFLSLRLWHLSTNLVRHYIAKLRVGFEYPHQVQLVLLSFSRPALLITPRPNLSTHNVGQRRDWYSLAKHFSQVRSFQELLITRIESQLNSKFASGHRRVDRVRK